MSKKLQVIFTGRLLIIKNKKILLIREEEHWETPGGKLEPNETPIENIHREAIEELGTRIKLLNKVPLFYKARHKGKHIIFCYFFAKTLGRTKITEDNYEALEIKYLSKKEILNLIKEKNMSPGDAKFLPKAMKELVL